MNGAAVGESGASAYSSRTRVGRLADWVPPACCARHFPSRQRDTPPPTPRPTQCEPPLAHRARSYTGTAEYSCTSAMSASVPNGFRRKPSRADVRSSNAGGISSIAAMKMTGGGDPRVHKRSNTSKPFMPPSRTSSTRHEGSSGSVRPKYSSPELNVRATKRGARKTRRARDVSTDHHPQCRSTLNRATSPLGSSLLCG